MHHDPHQLVRVLGCSFVVSSALSTCLFTETLAATESDAISNPLEQFEPGDTFFDELSSGGYGPEMVVIPAGQFRMGCQSDCWQAWDASRSRLGIVNQPAHVVTFDQPFAVSKHEITTEDYARFVEATAAVPTNHEAPDRGRQPKDKVSWHDAVAYAQWLSSEAGVTYRLPSEAEWEYSARAGTRSKRYFPDDDSQFCEYANHLDASVASSDLPFPDAIQLIRNRNTACSDGIADGTADVARYLPNDFGIYDMHGNVSEWTQDCWNGSYIGAPSNGRAWESGDCSRRVVRGGAWWTATVPVAFRTSAKSSSRHIGTGIRVVREAAPEAAP